MTYLFKLLVKISQFKIFKIFNIPFTGNHRISPWNHTTFLPKNAILYRKSGRILQYINAWKFSQIYILSLLREWPISAFKGKKMVCLHQRNIIFIFFSVSTLYHIILVVTAIYIARFLWSLRLISEAYPENWQISETETFPK